MDELPCELFLLREVYHPTPLKTGGLPAGLKTRHVRGAGPDEVLVEYQGGAPLTGKRWLTADERGSIIGPTISAGASL